MAGLSNPLSTFFLSDAIAAVQNVLLRRTEQMTNINNARITMIDIPAGSAKKLSLFTTTAGASEK